jgi:hypothetical protein
LMIRVFGSCPLGMSRAITLQGGTLLFDVPPFSTIVRQHFLAQH